jgi:hypothetical protein
LLWNREALHCAFVRDGAPYEFVAHGIQRPDRGFEVLLNLLEAEGVICSFVPIGLTVGRMEYKATLLGELTPMRALFDWNTLH